LRPSELEIEQLELRRKNDILTAQGKVDMLHEHVYSGNIHATVDDLSEYLPIFCGPAQKNSKPVPAQTQITIDANKWNARGVIDLPKSSPVDFTANFSLPIGADWTAFQASPLNVTLDIPSIALANAPHFCRPEIFREGTLSGNISLSGTLLRPRIDGEVRLSGGKFQNPSLSLSEVTSQITFSGNRASLDFFNASARDVDLSLSGKLEFADTSDLVINIAGPTPIFDLTMRPIDCVSKIEVAPVTIALAPAIAEIEVRGALFQAGWTIGLRESLGPRSFAALDLNGIIRRFPLCFSSTNAEETTLLFGAPARPAQPGTTRPKKRRR
jgi:hypothetical protein